MEPDILRLYASTPPPMDEEAEEEDDEFGDFGTFSSVPNSLSFTELDTSLTFDPAVTLGASSPPELLSRVLGPPSSCNGVDQRTELVKVFDNDSLTNGCVTDVSSTPFSTGEVHTGCADHEFADFSAFTNGHSTQSSEHRPQGTIRTEWQEKVSGEGVVCPVSDDGTFTNFCTLAETSNGHTDVEDSSSDRFSSTETSLGRPLSNEEEFGDVSTTATPPDVSMSTPPDLDLAMPPDPSLTKPSTPPPDLDSDPPPHLDLGAPPDLDSALPLNLDLATPPDLDSAPPSELDSAPPSELDSAPPSDLGPLLQDDEDEFGDFGDPQPSFELHERTLTYCLAPGVQKNLDPEQDLGRSNPSVLPSSNNFGIFNAAEGWSSFSDQQDGDTWEAFRAEHRHHQPEETQTASLSMRVQQLLQLSFPLSVSELQDSSVVSLRTLLKSIEGEDTSHRAVWLKMQDVHEAEGLRYVWGGSHCNKALLSSLGIDTRNILFTGQKKQPVIVPMFAAGLGMLEPTKEPVKFISAAEMIASIGQSPADDCSENQQESLPPVQFDWSSSGLTNPLDANGSSSVLNLDFFGPVEDSGSAPFTGVDPELFELTTAKMEDSSSRVLDAFSRLMSTMDRTTSTRKLKKTETLSAEASSVLSSLPDLSFMQAKVLMFPSTLTPFTH